MKKNVNFFRNYFLHKKSIRKWNQIEYIFWIKTNMKSNIIVICQGIVCAVNYFQNSIYCRRNEFLIEITLLTHCKYLFELNFKRILCSFTSLYRTYLYIYCYAEQGKDEIIYQKSILFLFKTLPEENVFIIRKRLRKWKQNYWKFSFFLYYLKKKIGSFYFILLK